MTTIRLSIDDARALAHALYPDIDTRAMSVPRVTALLSNYAANHPCDPARSTVAAGERPLGVVVTRSDCKRP
jgi:hypothetical protein